MFHVQVNFLLKCFMSRWISYWNVTFSGEFLIEMLQGQVNYLLQYNFAKWITHLNVAGLNEWLKLEWYMDKWNYYSSILIIFHIVSAGTWGPHHPTNDPISLRKPKDLHMAGDPKGGQCEPPRGRGRLEHGTRQKENAVYSEHCQLYEQQVADNHWLSFCTCLWLQDCTWFWVPQPSPEGPNILSSPWHICMRNIVFMRGLRGHWRGSGCSSGP